MTESEFEVHCQQVKVAGYTVVENPLSEEECDTAIRELERLVKEKDRGGHECLFNKASDFRIGRAAALSRTPAVGSLRACAEGGVQRTEARLR